MITDNYSTSVVFVTVTLSVRELVLLLLPPLPFANKTMISISTTAPTAHTHGSAYQVVSVLDVLVVVAVVVLSCAHARARIVVNAISRNAYLKSRGLNDFFKSLFFGVIKCAL